MTKKNIIYWGFVIAYVVLCVHTLVSFWTHDQAWIDGEISVLFFLKMNVWTFPIGISFVTIGVLMLDALKAIGLDLSSFFNLQAEYIFIWLIMTLLGYFQWFILVPRVYKIIARKFTHSK
ncbi:MAG: hypothetical protein BMS9Abin09_0184 [Gammaproteobacteria bacterium]|nr:MAG: hypothetical protein BMS9Abin09_0184 [Gammaproteobacteria bacterium]